MGDSSQYEIDIVTTGDVSGAAKEQEALQAVGDAAKAIPPETTVEVKASTADAQGSLAQTQTALKAVATAAKAIPAEVLVAVKADTAQAEGKLASVKESLASLLEAIEAGTGVAIGEKLVEGLDEIVDKLKEAVAEGIEFDKEMETLGISLAAALRQADPTKFINWDTAKSAGESALEAIRTKANQLGLDIRGLGEAVSTNLVALTEGGITDLNQQIETTSLLLQAAAAKGVQGFQATKDIIDIVQGKASRVILATELGITDEDIANAKEAGELYGYLVDKLGAYKQAAGDASGSLSGLEQTFHNLTSSLAGEATAPIFEALKSFYAASNQFLLDHPELGKDFAAIADAIVNWLEPLGAALKMVADIVAALGAAASWWLQITGQAQNANDKVKVHMETLDEVKARVQGVAAGHASVTAAIDSGNKSLDTQKTKVDQVTDAAKAAAKAVSDWQKGYDDAQAAVDKLRDKLKAVNLADLDPADKVKALNDEITTLQTKLTALGVAAKTPQAAINQLSNFGPAAQAKMAPLIDDWIKLQGEVAKAGDAEKKASAQAAKDEADYQKSINTTIAQIKAKAEALGLTVKTPEAPKTATSDDEKALADAMAKRDAQTDPQNWTNYDSIVQQIQQRLTDTFQQQIDTEIGLLKKPTTPADSGIPTPTSPTASSPASLPAPAGGAANAATGANSGSSSTAASDLQAMLKTVTDQLDAVRLIAQQGQTDIPARLGDLQTALSGLFTDTESKIVDVTTATTTTGGKIPDLISQLSDAVTASNMAIVNAFNAAIAAQQRQIDTLAAQVSRLS